MECCERTKKMPRDENTIKCLKTRINRITGQLNGISKMIDENRYCGDILIQIAAIENALKEVGYMVLKDHMLSCVVSDIQNNDFASLEEAIEITKKLK